MLGVFVWTFKDLVGAILLGATLIVFLIAIIAVAIDDWKKKRRQRKE